MRRPTLRIQRRDAERAGAVIATIAIVALVIGPDLRLGPIAPEPGPSGALASGESPTPPENWESLELPPVQLVADLTPTLGDGSNVTTSAAFTLKSLTDTPAAELAGRLRATPLVDMAIEPGATPDVVTVRPKEPLGAGVRYRFELLAPDGSLSASWLFRTAGPLHAVAFVPDFRATGVPVNTGIEVTFDQDSPINFESHFAIEPQVAGRFEAHGRTWAFVPAAPLAAATVYTVTVSHGVGVEGSDEVLESDVQFAFETAPEGAGSAAEASVHFLQPLAETRPGETPAFEADVFTRDSSPIPTTLPVEVYRLSSLVAAVDAAATLQPNYDWAQWSSIGLVDTAGLERVATFDAPVSPFSYRSALVLPTALPQGWYLVVVPRQMRDAQVLLQVTDLAMYAMASMTRTVIWLNELATDQPIAGGSIALASETSLGTTAEDGLLNLATPAALAKAPAAASGWRTHLLIATAPDGRQVIAPVGYGWDPTPGSFDDSMPALQAHDAWWHLLATDRYQYRSTDTVHVWGVIRSRGDRSVPRNAELRVSTDGASSATPIFKVPLDPTARGAFTADVPLVDLPNGYYSASVVVGDDEVATTSFQVTEIRKPAYRIDVTTDSHAYLLGEPIEASATVAFYDGTVAPGIALRFSNVATSSQEPNAVSATTSGIGLATATLPTIPVDAEGYTQQRITVVPSEPEQGEINGFRDVAVFKSTAWLDGSARLDATGLTVSGTLSAVDFEKVERSMAASDQVGDPAGAPIVGRTVTAAVVHLVPERVQDGSTYDFISKTVVPRYVTNIRDEVVGNPTVTTDSDGRFSFVAPVPTTTDGYRVVLTSHDRGGRAIVQSLYVFAAVDREASAGPYLEQPALCGFGARREAKVDEEFTLTVHEADGSVAAGRFLFLTGRQGITEARLSDTATWSGALPEAALPGFTVTAVRISSSGYDVTNDLRVQVLPADKTLEVTLGPEQSGYRPGDTVKIDITTTTAAGAPIAADVFVRGVDEKLYTLGAAFDVDAVGQLMAPLGSGYGRSYASHRVPRLSGDGCGAGGGDDRDDFRDAVTFQLVSTDSQGRGNVSFEVPDDLTSWHVSATAVSEGLDSGSAAVLVPVGLPFFVEASLAPEYLVGEQPVLRLRAYGDDLEDGQPVQFTVSAPTLGLTETTVDATAFVAAEMPLPKLTLGDHRLRIEGRRTGSGAALIDSLIRIVHVVPTRLDTLHTATESMTARLTPAGGDGLTSYVVSDAGRGALLPLLRELAADDGARFDEAIASQVARDLLVSELGVPTDTLPPASFELTTYERSEVVASGSPFTFTGLALLPYSSADLALTAHAVVAFPDRVNVYAVTNGLDLALEQAGDNHERRIMALTGMASLGRDVAAELRAIDPTPLTIREQLWLALGLEAVGDAAAARQLERSILAAHGQRQGPWVRLNVGSTLSDIIEASSLLLLLSAKLGDPIGADLSAYLRNSGSREQLAVLDQVVYARGALERLPRTAGRFAWSVDGERHEEALEPGGTFAITTTGPQRGTLIFERLEGDLAVSASWLGPTSDAELPDDPQVTVVRTVTPADDAPTDQLVRVRLDVTISPTAPKGCYEVTEFAPSGLAPASVSQGWAPSGIILAPYEIEGQRASWCLSTDMQRTYGLSYLARVVSPGTYTWEPAVAQLVTAPTVGNATDKSTYTIR